MAVEGAFLRGRVRTQFALMILDFQVDRVVMLGQPIPTGCRVPAGCAAVRLLPGQVRAGCHRGRSPRQKCGGPRTCCQSADGP